MKCLKYSPSVVAALVGAVVLAGSSQVRADFELRYSLNGAAFVTIGTTSSNPGSVSGAVDGINITGTASDSLSTQISKLDLAVSGILNTSITSLVVEASVTSVPTQPPPQAFSWSFTSSSDPGTGEHGQGWVDQSNQLYGGAIGGPGGTNIVATTGVLTAPATGSKSFSATPSYSWTIQYSVGALANGTALSTDNREQISTPAPAGLILALSGMPVLGVGAWFRRRRELATA
jgi:hypothetical protein